MTTIQGSPGGALTVSTASGGKVYAYNAMNTTPLQVAPANPARQKIQFHNPSDVDIYVAPLKAYTSYDDETPGTLTPSTAALGGCRTVYANGGTLEIVGECQDGWQAFTASGTGKALTVMDSNI